MDTQVPDAVIKERFGRLLKEVQKISAEETGRLAGTVQEVLVEGTNDHDPSLVTGRMTNNLLVHFPGDESMIGTFRRVSLDNCKGFYYIGTERR